MLAAGVVPDADVLKPGHHGSEMSTSAPFLEVAKYSLSAARLPLLEASPISSLASGGAGSICEVKTGNPSPAHSVQLILWMYAVPEALPQCRGVTFGGKVVYNDRMVEIPAWAVDHREAADRPRRCLLV